MAQAKQNVLHNCLAFLSCAFHRIPVIRHNGGHLVINRILFLDELPFDIPVVRWMVDFELDRIFTAVMPLYTGALLIYYF